MTNQENINAMKQQMEDTAIFLETMANTLDKWAQSSRTGGWSTHQVEANEREADRCRRKAAQIRLSINQ